MKNLITISLLFFYVDVFSQNVGIGETLPTESKLQIKTIDSAALIVQNTSTANNAKTALFYKTDNNFSGSIATVKTAALTYRMGFYTFGGAAASALKERMSISDNGNVGIGTTNPTAKLEVVGTFKIADGTQGAGKVLSSDAAGNATWATQAPLAFGNTERFQFNIYKTNTNNGQLDTYYNFGTASTSYTTGNQFFNLNITKSGLYHFDVNLSHNVNADYSQKSVNPRNVKFQLLDFGFGTIYTGYSSYNFNNASANSEASFEKSFDKYITAPAQIRFLSTTTNTGIFELNYLVTGHLISD